MFQNWYQQSRESSNEIFLVLTIIFVVFGAFVALVWWIVKLSRQNRLAGGVIVNDNADEIGEERMITAKKLESYKQLLCNIDENDENQLGNNQLANSLQCLDYYYMNKWATLLREAVDTNSLDLTVQQVLREIDDHTDLYQLSLEQKQDLWDLAQLTDSIYIRNST